MADQTRTVTIRKQDGFDEYMAEHHGSTAFQNAIGYLSEWNMWANRFDTVTITCQLGRNGDQPELGASYRSTANGDGYFICGIFQPQKGPTDDDLDNCRHGQLARFTFHS